MVVINNHYASNTNTVLNETHNNVVVINNTLYST